DLFLQRARLAAQHRQPATARAAGEHPDHLRAGRVARRRVVVLRLLRAGGAAEAVSPRLPVQRVPARADRFVLPFDRAAGGGARRRRGRAGGRGRGGGDIGRRRRGVRTMTARVSTLAFAAALVALTASACDENILDPMADRQPKANRYRESKFFEDGLVMMA